MVWLHDGGFDFKLHADKNQEGKWVLSLSSPTLPEKYNKNIIETDTKKKARSFAFDWRKSHTKTDELLRESGISVGNSRKVFNPFNMSLALMNLFLLLALLQTWKFIDPIFGEIFIGIVMGAGGLIFLVEGFYKDGLFDIKAPLLNAEEAVSLLTGVFAILSSYGYITQSEFYLTHFSGVQGGILAYMVAYLTIHWLKNKFLGYSRLTVRATRNKAGAMKKNLLN
ncbi:MAG: hypothetical protein R6V35_05385 [Candidatus Nanohaloarchaea archaeon]